MQPLVAKKLEDAYICQPVLHNVKGAGSRALNIMGQILQPEQGVALMSIVGRIAKRYFKGRVYTCMSFSTFEHFDSKPNYVKRDPIV